MGDAFRRVGSRVWWSEEAAEASGTAGAGAEVGAGAVAASPPAAAERCSPSSSHRSADSGFSDRSGSPSGNPFLGRLELSCFERSPPAPNAKSEPTQQHAAAGAESPTSLAACATLDLTGLEPPAHTSTPKGDASPAPSPSTPGRSLASRRQGCPVNLLSAFNRRLPGAPCWPQKEEDGSAAALGAPVRRWLRELALACEPECTTTLQSKSLAADLGRQVAAAAAAATHSVRALQEGTRRIAAEFNKLCRQLELGTMEHLGPLVQSLTGHVAEFARQQQRQPVQDQQQQRPQTGSCSSSPTSLPPPELDQAIDALRRSAGQPAPDADQLTAHTAALGAAFTAVVDSALLTHIAVLVAVLETPSSEMALRAALAALAALGLEGRHLSTLVAASGGVRALLGVVLESRCSSVRVAALRALAAVACAPEAIRSLEQAGGVEVLAELLADKGRPEPELAEAAAVLAQVTAPWVEDNPGVRGLAEHLPPIIQALARLADTTKSQETLLLAAAALANVTYMEPRAVWPLLSTGAAGCLLQAVRRLGPAASVFLQEQAAALLASMAAVPESRGPLAAQRAVVALLCFLQVRASPLQDQPEIAAAERLQHKSAIALSRLCSDPEVANQVVELQGVSRLVRLCKDERERNHSDGVLVACLAALRKISANCGTQVIEDLNALELVEPRLLDSFLLYSSRQESYV